MPRHNSNRRERDSTNREKDTHEAEDLTKRPVNVILLGTSGNGKSATGNSIIGKRVFKTSAGSSSLESAVVKMSTKFKDIEINVIDIPGIDTDNSSDDVLNTFKAFIDNAFEECPEGFSALVLVLKYGNRFTKQETEMLNLIKSTLGEGVINNNVICLLTHGDLFEEDMKHEGKSVEFNAWCEEQTGEIQKLFEQCSYRCVLFNNKTRDENAKYEQIQLLLSSSKKTRTYSKDDFLSAETGRKRVKLENSSTKIMERTHEFLHKKRTRMSEIENIGDASKQINELKIILNELKDFHEQISDTGCIFNKAHNPTNYICALESEIESKIKVKELEKLQSSAYRVSDIQFKESGNAHRRKRSDSPELDQHDKQSHFSRDSQSRSMPIRKKSGRRSQKKQERAEKEQSKGFNRGSTGRNTTPAPKIENRVVQEKESTTKQDKKDKKACHIL